MIQVNKPFKPLYTAPSKYFLITGGRGSAKSFNVATFANVLSFESDHRILYVRETMTSAHLSIIPEFAEKIELMGLQHFFQATKNEIVNLRSESDILFRGIRTSRGDQTANLKSLQGVTTLILDEGEELTDEKKFDDIVLSIRSRKRQNRVIIIMNPTTKEHWVYKRFFESKGVTPGVCATIGDTTYIHTTYLDNIKNLPEDYVAEAELMKHSNPQKYHHIMMGGWLEKAEGVVFTNWEYGEFNPAGRQTAFGQDYGWSVDPTTLIEVAVDNDKKIIWVKEHLYRARMSTSEIAAVNLEVAGRKMIVGDGAEPRLIDELASLGCNIYKADKGPGSHSVGISLMLDFKIVVDPQSKNIARELNNFCYADRGQRLTIDGYDHAIDAIKYVLPQMITARRGVEIR